MSQARYKSAHISEIVRDRDMVLMGKSYPDYRIVPLSIKVTIYSM